MSANNHSAAFGWAGIIAVAIFTFMWLGCCAADPTWTWGQNTISDFGSAPNQAADIFAYGCFFFGIVLGIYGVGKVQTGKTADCTAGILFLVTGICVAVVGICTNNFDGDYHKFAAIVGGICVAAAVLATLIQNYLDGRIIPVGIGIILVITAIISALAFEFAEYEVILIAVGLIWIAIDACCMIGAGIKGGKQ